MLFNSVEVTVSRQMKASFMGNVKTDDGKMGNEEALGDVIYGNSDCEYST